MWRVSWQDYRGWRTAGITEARPLVYTEDHETREAANQAAALLKAQGVAACVTPVPQPRRGRRSSQARIDDGSDKFNASWTLYS